MRPQKRAPPKEPPGHGEEIWVFSCHRTNQVVFSFEQNVHRHHVLKQIPFAGKKSKPAVIRKDLWAPLAHLKFPKGLGQVGISVFRQLRELKHLGEVSWDTNLIYKRPSEYTEEEKERLRENPDSPRPLRTLAQRSSAINDQKRQVIANIAAILSGEGVGNRMWISQLGLSLAQHVNAQRFAQIKVNQMRRKIFLRLRSRANKLAYEEDKLDMINAFNDRRASDSSRGWAKQLVEARNNLLEDPVITLCRVTVSWANEQDKHYAMKWTDNVTHDLIHSDDCYDVESRIQVPVELSKGLPAQDIERPVMDIESTLKAGAVS
ncbi:hypothetical protein XA68_11759 [Ophiocordyceps unilateralis]|uniref:Large ribosomal subunit protein mL67 n=1 Tax=Ophiocordyceps unilateralis TaxID=268505 RepID=A0A2A9PG56_OPHUN|nr:hypothetical protein XA68_11759 [Ophiocordyceps unilateralis]